MIAWWQWNEVSPSAPGTAASSLAVQNSGSFLPLGVAGPLDDALGLTIVAELIGSTGGTLGLWIQSSLDETNYFDCVAFTQLTAGNAAVIYRTSVDFVAQPSSAAPTTVGKGLAPALAAGNVVQGPWGSRMRLVMTAGSGTTAGAPVRVTLLAQRPRLGLL